MRGIYVHDSSAIAYLLDPTAFQVEHWPVRVETQGLSRGKTWPCVDGIDGDVPPPWQGRPLVNVCVDVDAGASCNWSAAGYCDAGGSIGG